MSTARPRVLLATCALLPQGEPGGDALVAALATRGVDAAWAVWDDPSVDWAGADLVAVRATWDYHLRPEAFLTWARAVEDATVLLNGADAMTWSSDKEYLLRLSAEVWTVPSVPIEVEDVVGGLRPAFERWGTLVVKPRVGASGQGLVVATGLEDPRLLGLTPGPWLAQPLVASVRTRGESSVVLVAGRPVAQVDKRPGSAGDGADVRVHEEYGGTSVAVPVDPDAGALARAAVEATQKLLGREEALDYARVDLLEMDGMLVVSEVELVEPGLYLDLVPAVADAFAEHLVTRLAR
ncbi:ATP-grasp domain-containing protein [Nocardioides bruguierae]|uniref:ATP-grasp domain-containing protein n=1 Tax=Nocardioides bruguierae TaxID=2945102 RepID=UPI002020F3AF|nr:hypothetical protein [Nocardioides bruguierae]MCL8025217.1 hypothetical protein [Nocardioides bruguierae]